MTTQGGRGEADQWRNPTVSQLESCIGGVLDRIKSNVAVGAGADVDRSSNKKKREGRDDASTATKQPAMTTTEEEKPDGRPFRTNLSGKKTRSNEVAPTTSTTPIAPMPTRTTMTEKNTASSGGDGEGGGGEGGDAAAADAVREQIKARLRQKGWS